MSKEAFKPKLVKGEARPERVPRRFRGIRLRRRTARQRRGADFGWLVTVVAVAVVTVIVVLAGFVLRLG